MSGYIELTRIEGTSPKTPTVTTEWDAPPCKLATTTRPYKGRAVWGPENRSYCPGCKRTCALPRGIAPRDEFEVRR